MQTLRNGQPFNLTWFESVLRWSIEDPRSDAKGLGLMASYPSCGEHYCRFKSPKCGLVAVGVEDGFPYFVLHVEGQAMPFHYRMQYGNQIPAFLEWLNKNAIMNVREKLIPEIPEAVVFIAQPSETSSIRKIVELQAA